MTHSPKRASLSSLIRSSLSPTFFYPDSLDRDNLDGRNRSLVPKSSQFPSPTHSHLDTIMGVCANFSRTHRDLVNLYFLTWETIYEERKLRKSHRHFMQILCTVIFSQRSKSRNKIDKYEKLVLSIQNKKALS